jgi:hypothetical protein
VRKLRKSPSSLRKEMAETATLRILWRVNDQRGHPAVDRVARVLELLVEAEETRTEIRRRAFSTFPPLIH